MLTMNWSYFLIFLSQFDILTSVNTLISTLNKEILSEWEVCILCIAYGFMKIVLFFTFLGLEASTWKILQIGSGGEFPENDLAAKQSQD